jgi:hypothetical protein
MRRKVLSREVCMRDVLPMSLEGFREMPADKRRTYICRLNGEQQNAYARTLMGGNYLDEKMKEQIRLEFANYPNFGDYLSRMIELAMPSHEEFHSENFLTGARGTNKKHESIPVSTHRSPEPNSLGEKNLGEDISWV